MNYNKAIYFIFIEKVVLSQIGMPDTTSYTEDNMRVVPTHLGHQPPPSSGFTA